MENTARKLIPINGRDQSVIRTGTVVSVENDEVDINIEGEIITAQKAFSCIVDVEPSDIVISVENEAGQVYILSIIERPESKKMNMSFPGSTNMKTLEGSLNINSADSISIASDNMNCFSNKAIHKSREAIIAYENTVASGNELQANYKTIRLISNLINTMAKQVVDKFIGYIRSTERNDMVKAGHMRRQSEGLFSMDSDTTLMNSKKSTKIDGEKILMG